MTLSRLIAANVKRIRLSRGLSQAQLAQQMGYERNNLAQWEWRGVRSVAVLEELARGLNVTVELNPVIQAQFAKLFEVGQSDASVGEIDWESVVRNWDLPFPKKRQGRR
jgi:transcriptional regulator with XRE-family HTH domain